MTTSQPKTAQKPLLHSSEILMRSVTSQSDLEGFKKKGKFPVSLFRPDDPDLSVDLFTNISMGEAVRLGWGRAAKRGKDKHGKSRKLHGWALCLVMDAEWFSGIAKLTPTDDNRHHVSVYKPTNSAQIASHRHHLAEKSKWCPHPRLSFRQKVVEQFLP